MSTSCSKLCIVIVCGLPGVGKTTFTRKLASVLAFEGVKCIHLEYDQFEQQERSQKKKLPTESLTQSNQATFDSSAWKSARERIEDLVEQLLSGSMQPDNPVLQETNHMFNDLKSIDQLYIILDDNMYYHSMRNYFFKLCQKYKAGFVQIYLHAPLEFAINNDQQRPTERQVGSHVIQQMKYKLEEPDPVHNTWEKHTIILDASKLDLSDNTRIQNVFDELMQMAQDPLPEPPIEDEEEKERSRLANFESTVHQFDLRSRKLLATLIPKNSAKASVIASKLNQKRKDFLQALKASPSDYNKYTLDELEALFVEEANKMVAEL